MNAELRTCGLMVIGPWARNVTYIALEYSTIAFGEQLSESYLTNVRHLYSLSSNCLLGRTIWRTILRNIVH